MRVVGIDLAVRAKHQAIISDQRGRFISPVIKVETRLADLEKLRSQALQGAEPECSLVVVMEATDITWYPVSVYFLKQGDTVYVVNPRMSADLGRFYKRHAKSDRLAAKTLTRLPFVNPEHLYPLMPVGREYLSLQRGCKELDRLIIQTSAIKNRLRAIDRLGWPDLPKRVFSSSTDTVVCWFRDHFYDPHQVIRAGAAGIRRAWHESGQDRDNDPEWIEALVELAQETQQLYGGTLGVYLDYQALTAEVRREQARLTRLEDDARHLKLKVIRPLYRRLHPSRHLETVMGVGQEGAAVYLSFIGVPERFATNRKIRGWSGMVPRSDQSGEGEGKGLRISKAGPNLVKKYAYLNAEVARRWDPQLAAIYFDQMVNKGKHHTQAVCVCATHLLDRVRVVLIEDRPYELRDVDETPVTTQQAQAIIQERYTVPQAVRQRNNRRSRRERAERRAEHKEQKRRSRSS